MSRQRNQSGSALTIIVILVVIAVLSTLGIVFWQKYMSAKPTVSSIDTFSDCKKDTASKMLITLPEQCVTADGKTFTDVSQKINPNADLTEVVASSLVDRELTLHYPKSWTIVTDEQGNKNSIQEPYLKNVKITSPSGKFSIRFNIMKNGGLGGACDPETVKVTKLETTLLSSLPNLRFAESILHFTDQNSDTYTYRSEIQRLSPEILATKVGGTGCNFMYAGLFSKGSVDMGENGSLASVSIVANALESDTQITDKQKIIDALSGAEYNTAKRILLTLTDT